MESSVGPRQRYINRLVNDIVHDDHGKYESTSLVELVSEKSIDLWRLENCYTSTRGIHGRLAAASEEAGVVIVEFRENLAKRLEAELKAAVNELVQTGVNIRYTPLVSELVNLS